jgi:hypothetical protein
MAELGEAHALVKDLEPSTPQEYILKVTRPDVCAKPHVRAAWRGVISMILQYL